MAQKPKFIQSVYSGWTQNIVTILNLSIACIVEEPSVTTFFILTYHGRKLAFNSRVLLNYGCYYYFFGRQVNYPELRPKSK